MKIRIFLCRSAFICAFMAIATTELAQAQPAIIKMVVPFPAGGVTDQAARIVAEKMSKQLGQNIIIENRPGAGTRLGVDAVTKAPADGSVLLFTNSSLNFLSIIDTKLPDPKKGLTPIGMSAIFGLLIVTNNMNPAKTLPEFIAYAKNNPGKLSYGSAGVGSGTHFAGEHFKALTGAFLVHIPYKSTTGALNDVVGGQLDLVFDAAAKPLIDAHQVRLLAVTGERRDPRFPSTPTAAEMGLKSFVHQSWLGILAPAATPPSVVDRLNKAATAATTDAGVQKRFAELGLQHQGGPASQLGNMVQAESTLYRKIASEAKLSFD